MIPAESRRHSGSTLLLWQVGRAVLALGRGDLDARRGGAVGDGSRRGRDDRAAVRRSVRRDAARSSRAATATSTARARLIDDTIDRIEYCSDDMARITARLGSRRARGGRRRPAGARPPGRRGGAPRPRARGRADRAHPAGGRVRRAGRGGGAGHGRGGVRPRHGRAARRARLWTRAAAAWDGLGRPYPVAYARWREAEALMARRDRDGAAAAASDALARARKLGSTWLVEEIESLAARARLQLGDGTPAPAARRVERRRGDDDPFGLTPRERERARPRGRRRHQPRDRRARCTWRRRPPACTCRASSRS